MTSWAAGVCRLLAFQIPLALPPMPLAGSLSTAG